MLTQLYNEDYVARRRNIEVPGGWDEAPCHFIVTLPVPTEKGMSVLLIPIVEVDGKIDMWQTATIHPVKKKVNA